MLGKRGEGDGLRMPGTRVGREEPMEQQRAAPWLRGQGLGKLLAGGQIADREPVCNGVASRGRGETGVRSGAGRGSMQ